MKKISYLTLVITLAILMLDSCSFQRNKLFKIPKGSDFTFDTLPSPEGFEYKIAVDDRISFTVLANNGEQIFLGGNQSGVGYGDFTVRKDGKAFIPIIGELKLEGLTVKQCEEILTKEISKYINDPYIKLNISNSRVIIFKGNGSIATIVPLHNAKTTLLEVIAQTGGIPDKGLANNIKIVRTENGTRKIYKVDLSTIDKLEYGEMLVQANDYIFIDDRIIIPTEISKEFLPYMTFISTLISSYSIIKLITK